MVLVRFRSVITRILQQESPKPNSFVAIERFGGKIRVTPQKIKTHPKGFEPHYPKKITMKTHYPLRHLVGVAEHEQRSVTEGCSDHFRNVW